MVAFLSKPILRHTNGFCSNVKKTSDIVVYRYEFSYSFLCTAVSRTILRNNAQWFTNDLSHELRPRHFAYIKSFNFLKQGNPAYPKVFKDVR